MSEIHQLPPPDNLDICAAWAVPIKCFDLLLLLLYYCYYYSFIYFLFYSLIYIHTLYNIISFVTKLC